MIDKQTSDERLLKLIEAAPADPKQRQMASAPKFGLHNLKPINFSPAAVNSYIKNIKINLFFVNKTVIGIACLLITLFFYVLATGPAISRSNAVYFTASDAESIAKLVSAKETQNLGRLPISAQDLKRNIFTVFGSKSAEPAQGEKSVEQNTVLTQMFKDFKLVGIIWSQAPEVMIENAKDSRTYTLKKGELLSDQIKIKEISRNSATLEMSSDSGAQEYELR